MLAKQILKQRAFDRSEEGMRLKTAEERAATFRKAVESLNRRSKAYKKYIKNMHGKYGAEIAALRESANADLNLARSAQEEIRRAGRKKFRIGTAAGLVAGAVGGLLVGRQKKLEEEQQFSKKEDRKGMNPYVMAGLSGSASGAVLGGIVPAIERIKVPKGASKSVLAAARKAKLGAIGRGAAIGGMLSGAIVGGGAKIGSMAVGEPRDDEGSAFTRRAGIGGTVVGATSGLLGAALVKSRGLRGAVTNLHKATKNRNKVIAGATAALRRAVVGSQNAIRTGAHRYAPINAIAKAGPLGGALMGAGAGGIYGLYQGLDEGQQVDSILNIRKDLKKLSSEDILIELAYGQGPRGNAVAAHRYRNKIDDEEWARKERNIMRSGVAGGALGALLRKRMPGGLAPALLVGAGTGIGAQLATQSMNPKDPFGDKSVQAKKAEALPWKIIAGTGAGLLGYRALRHIKRAKGKPIAMSSSGKVIAFERPEWLDEELTNIARGYIDNIKEREKNKALIKEVKRAERKTTQWRRNVDRTATLVKDLKLKMRGEKKYDERGRERKNEWDKSWVRNAAITAGGVTALLLAKGPIEKIRKEAAALRKTGKEGVGMPKLYNTVRKFVRKDPNSTPAKTIAERLAGTKWAPIGNAIEAIKRARREMKMWSTEKVTDIADALERLRTGAKRVRPMANPEGGMNFSATGRGINLEEEEIIPVSSHLRTRRRTKEELRKERISEERERHRLEKQLIGGAAAITGAGGAALWNRYSPKARETRRLAALNAEQIASEINAAKEFEKNVVNKHRAVEEAIEKRKMLRAMAKAGLKAGFRKAG